MEVKTYKELPAEAKMIRTKVFMEEQGFRNEFDETDRISIHIVLFEASEPVATCRIYYSEERKCYVIGRLAVLMDYRGKDVGSRLLNAAEKEILDRNGTAAELSAQERAAAFYEKNGYISLEDVYDDEGCPHVWMRKELFNGWRADQMTNNKHNCTKTKTGGRIEYQDFTLTLALFDALPVLFFCMAMCIIAVRFQNPFFLTGVVLCTCSGCGKVIWKILVACAGRDIRILNRQMRVLMPLGFLLVVAGLIRGRGQVDLAALAGRITAFPTCLFFGITVLGMICMSVFAVTLDAEKARSNWIEQITNAVAQGCFLLGVLTSI